MTDETVEAFLDANVLVYAASALPEDATKRARAIDLMRDVDFGVSAQVLQEFYNTATRKMRPRLSHGDAIAVVRKLALLPCVDVDLALIEAGAEVSNRHQISYWDGAVIAAAERLGATTLYSEDLNDGQRYGSVTVVNPFKNC